MDPVSATLLAAVITTSGQIVAAYIPSSSDSGRSDLAALTKEEFYKTLLEERKLNKKFIRNSIFNATQNFSNLIESFSKDIVSEIIDENRKQRLREVLQEVQAGIDSLNILMNAESIDQNIVINMIASSLNPLQVSLGKAKYAILDYGTKEMWLYCYILGTSAIISGYEFLGINMPNLRLELENTIKAVQIKMLDYLALTIISKNQTFPWSDVSHLISLEGIDDLFELYNSFIKRDIPESSNSSQIKPIDQKIYNSEMYNFALPDLGEGIQSGDVVNVLVAVGDYIEQDQTIIELETDKAVIEVPSPISGTIQKMHVQAGGKADVGQVIATILRNS